MGEAERGDTAPRREVKFFCAAGHVTAPSFAHDAIVPELWDCAQCGLPSSQDADNPPPEPRNEPYKTHLAYVKERRSEQAGAALLEEALKDLRRVRGS